MTDERGAIEAAFTDIARNFIGDRRHNRPGRIGAGCQSGKAAHMDEVIAIAGHSLHSRLPYFG